MSAWSPRVHINRSTKHHYGYINIEDIYQPRELSAAGAEETAKIWGGGGGKYATRTYLYGEKSYGVIVKVGGKCPSCPPCSASTERYHDNILHAMGPQIIWEIIRIA